MKKFIALVLILAFGFSISGCVTEELSLLYTESGEKDGFYIAVNKTANCCFVGQYTCSQYSENMEITIPDEYKNKPITRIGGYFGRGVSMPFCISLADLYMNATVGSEYDSVFSGDINDFNITDNYSVKDVPFILNIGKNIKYIENVKSDDYYPHVNQDGSVTFYHPVLEINCSKDNKYFYSKDGKLYDEKTNELISVFKYIES